METTKRILCFTDFSILCLSKLLINVSVVHGSVNNNKYAEYH